MNIMSNVPSPKQENEHHNNSENYCVFFVCHSMHLSKYFLLEKSYTKYNILKNDV